MAKLIGVYWSNPFNLSRPGEYTRSFRATGTAFQQKEEYPIRIDLQTVKDKNEKSHLARYFFYLLQIQQH